MLYSNFYFVVQRYTTEIMVQYVRGIAIAAGMLFVMELMALMIDAQKDLPVDMGGSFPYLGPCDRMKAFTVSAGWECFIAVPEVTARYGAVLTGT